MHVLGLSAPLHDSAAALLGEKGIVAAIEESKLARSPNCGGIPRASIRFCLERAGVRWRDLDYVAVASRPLRAWARQAWMRGKMAPLAPIAHAYYQTKLLGELGRELNNFRILKVMTEGTRPVLDLDHHLCHAASAFYAAPFDRALIVTLDEQGDGWSGSTAMGEGNEIHALRPIAFPHSLGWVYSQVTELLGFVPQREEHKTQWLSLEGEPVFKDVFLEILRRPPDPRPRLDYSYFTRGLVGRVAFSKKFYRRLGLESAQQVERDERLRRQIAASLQRACAEVVTEWAESLRRETRARYLCLAGGVFLNVLLVAELEKNAGFDKIFVQPAAGNAGCAPGAAWLVWHKVLGKPRVPPVSHLYWGPSYTSEGIKEVLDNCKARYCWQETETRMIEETARLLVEGKIVAWYQGAAEFGPRALGNRSLLASPWAPYVKENLNQYVKHRESFRSFAVAVPEEDCGKYFESSELGHFMTSLGRARPAARDLLKDFLLPEDRVRLHVVERGTNPLFWQLLKNFGERAPAPFLVNTSFNLFGEPLVITPRGALQSFFCSGIDALLMGGFLVTKSWEVRLVMDSRADQLHHENQ